MNRCLDPNFLIFCLVGFGFGFGGFGFLLGVFWVENQGGNKVEEWKWLLITAASIVWIGSILILGVIDE